MGETQSKPDLAVTFSDNNAENKQVYVELNNHKYGEDQEYSREVNGLFGKFAICMGVVIYQENLLHVTGNDPPNPITLVTKEKCEREFITAFRELNATHSV